ncbi:EF-hand domain-containing protein [Sneathiella sp. CAU 1612]|jgi:Ca2+-binding EF-hand superfamily protein|uniref:EF-hand domain-containing protein n=1 Tax=Sneathiella sedimenti TaxID=2816034 RepID=A0ABS3F1B4_9PROT|nr:EF-hand domain-containing protein [Sneathiella sedimenti]MBO0332301.1 EF-hand domain-containing protein [Sneathiella sedimenti]
MKRKIIIGSMIAALAIPALAIAATDGPHKGHHKGDIFERLDTNKDGEISFEEMTVRSTERFSRLDKDGNGTISVEEMTVKKKEFFDKLDKDGNGSISKEEARAFHDMKREMRKERHASRMLEILDIDKDGVVTKEEFAAASDKRFEAADGNKDGVLSAEELQNMGPKKHGMKKG